MKEVYGIAQVVPCGRYMDKSFVGSELSDYDDYVEFLISLYYVELGPLCRFQNQIDGLAVVFNIEPVTDISRAMRAGVFRLALAIMSGMSFSGN